jgi:hypothetical protein
MQFHPSTAESPKLQASSCTLQANTAENGNTASPIGQKLKARPDKFIQAGF